MPTGKVKWYDAEKGFGFLSQEDGPDVYVRAAALPAGVASLKPGTRVEFGIVQGRKGDQALQVRLLEPAQSVSKSLRKKPADMVNIVEDPRLGRHRVHGGGVDLDAGAVAEVPDAQVTHRDGGVAEHGPHGGLRPLDPGQPERADLDPVGHPRGQAGRGRLVPGGQSPTS